MQLELEIEGRLAASLLRSMSTTTSLEVFLFLQSLLVVNKAVNCKSIKKVHSHSTGLLNGFCVLIMIKA